MFSKSQSIIEMVEKSVEQELQGDYDRGGFKHAHRHDNQLTDVELKEVERLKKLELSLRQKNASKLQNLNVIKDNVKRWKTVDI